MRIVIPTFKREHRQITFSRMPRSIQARTTVYTHSGRADTLRRALPTATVADLGVTDGIADVRQKILEHALSQGHGKVFMVDDSCYFYKRWVQDEKSRTGEMTEAGWHDMLAQAEALLDMYPQVAISPKPGCQTYLGDLRDVGRAYTCYALNAAKLAEMGVRFDGMYRKNPQIKLYEDYYLTLSMLTRGVPNAILYTYVFNASHNLPGGNSVHRTFDLQKECCEALQAEFPEFVKVKRLESKTWNSGDGTRYEAQIAWKKAYEHGLSVAANSNLL